METKEIIDKIDAGVELTPAEMELLLGIEDEKQLDAFFKAAYRIKKREIGKIVHFRGIIECSNICTKDCYYCGIRKGNDKVDRYLMEPQEMYEEAMWASEQGYGSIVIQSGEREDEKYVSMIEDVLKRIKKDTAGKLGITLSLGEQSLETYQRWFKAGGHRYLLRLETSNETLYKKIHPSDHSFSRRKACLSDLRKAGYQVGTGFMMGLPGQSLADMVQDVLFLKEIDIDMVGMGPYIPHHDTPLGKDIPSYTPDENNKLIKLGLKMIALVRVVLKDVNIAAATALQALESDGREQGLLAGANIIMPNITETEFRPNYTLYENKPCLDENSGMCRGCLETRIGSIGETIGYNEWGDSQHFKNRQ